MVGNDWIFFITICCMSSKHVLEVKIVTDCMWCIPCGVISVQFLWLQLILVMCVLVDKYSCLFIFLGYSRHGRAGARICIWHFGDYQSPCKNSWGSSWGPCCTVFYYRTEGSCYFPEQIHGRLMNYLSCTTLWRLMVAIALRFISNNVFLRFFYTYKPDLACTKYRYIMNFFLI